MNAQLKDAVYRTLVNRVPGIRERYLHRREQKPGMALGYLLWLNFQYYCLFRRSLGASIRHPVYEQRRLYSAASESSLSARERPEDFAARLAAFGLVSFDVFDTLVFRPFSSPGDLFCLVGAALDYPDFKSIRMEAEKLARDRKQAQQGTREVTLEDIWSVVEEETGIPREEGMRAEWEQERRCCFANPYMLQVVRLLHSGGKRLLALSDMYLGRERVEQLLRECGYPDFNDCFVSCDAGVSKSGGALYDRVRETLAVGEETAWVHVGDNPYADREQAMRHHVGAFSYPNVNAAGAPYRTADMSAVTGSLYRGIVNAHIHSGLAVYSREYEYGFIYGGLFVTGYCRFIHRCARAQQLDKLLFLSRDGAVLLEAYRRLYPEEAGRTVYARWSRQAALKVTARYYRREYLRRFLFHKAGHGFSLRRVLESMELADMLEALCGKIKETPDAELTYKNAEKIKSYLLEHWDETLSHYDEQVSAGGAYYREMLQGCRRAAAVDIGWAGSGALMLRCALQHIWGLDCALTGIVAGTAGAQSTEADAGEVFLFSGQLVSYLYSQQDNRDLWKYHDAARGHNLYWELLLGAPEGSLQGFYWGDNGKPACRLRENTADAGRIREIHRGILDFVQCFSEAERRMGHTIPISGRDAYAPMINVISEKNKAFRAELEALLDDMHIA